MEEILVKTRVLNMIRSHLQIDQIRVEKLQLWKMIENRESRFTFSSPLISTLMCNLMAPDTADLSVRFSRLYHTSISPDKVRTCEREKRTKRNKNRARWLWRIYRELWRDLFSYLFALRLWCSRVEFSSVIVKRGRRVQRRNDMNEKTIF